VARQPPACAAATEPRIVRYWPPMRAAFSLPDRRDARPGADPAGHRRRAEAAKQNQRTPRPARAARIEPAGPEVHEIKNQRVEDLQRHMADWRPLFNPGAELTQPLAMAD
jgi:hypothetical protein